MADPQTDPIEAAFAAAKASAPDPIEDAFRAAKSTSEPFTGPIQPEEPTSPSAHGITDPASVSVTGPFTVPTRKLVDLPNPVEGAKQFGKGFYGLGSALGAPHKGEASEAMRAGSDMIEGIFQLAAPLIAAQAAEAPLATAWGLVKAYVAGKAGTKAAETLTDNPDAHRLAGDLAAAISGVKSVNDFAEGNIATAAKVMAEAAKAKGRALTLAAKLSGSGQGTGDVPGFRANPSFEEPMVERAAREASQERSASESQAAQEAVDEARQNQPPQGQRPPQVTPVEQVPTDVQAAYEQAKRVTDQRGGRTADQIAALPQGPTNQWTQDEQGRPVPTVTVPPPADLQPAVEAAAIGHPYQASTEAIQAEQEAGSASLPRGVSESEPVETPDEQTAALAAYDAAKAPAQASTAVAPTLAVQFGPGNVLPVASRDDVKGLVRQVVDRFYEEHGPGTSDLLPPIHLVENGSVIAAIGPNGHIQEAAKGVESPHGEVATPPVTDGANRPSVEGSGALESGGRNENAARPRVPAEPFERFVKRPASEHAHRFTPEVTRELTRLEEELSTFPHTPRTWQDLSHEHGLRGNASGGHAQITGAVSGAEAYRDILSQSPVNVVTSGRRKGELAKEPGGSQAKILHAVRRVLASKDITNNLMEGAVKVAELRAAGDYRVIKTPALPPSWGTQSPAVEAALDAAYDAPSDADAWEEALHKLQDEEASGDVDFDPDTLEAQPRLPEAGSVREQEHATPQFEAPFSLSGEAEERKAVEPDLFGNEKPTFSARSEPAPIFYSALTRAAEGLKQNRGTPEQMAAMLEKAPGIKKEELDWSGVLPWIKGQAQFVTKAAIVDYLQKNELQVTETLRGEVTPELSPDDVEMRRIESENPYWESYDRRTGTLITRHSGVMNEADAIKNAVALGPRQGKPTKFGGQDTVLPGGANYRELLITLPLPARYDARKAVYGKHQPAIDAVDEQIALTIRHANRSRQDGRTLRQLQDERERLEIARDEEADEAGGEANEGDAFRGGHFDDPNVLAHVRFDDRMDADGKRVLFIEEIQSDWHQKGRKHGYKTDAQERFDKLKDEIQKKHGKGLIELRWNNDGSPLSADVAADLARLDAVYAEAQTEQHGYQVPDAPFKTTWQELAARRMVRYAAEHGYDRIAWTPGSIQNDRYDLSKHVSEVVLIKNHEGREFVTAADLRHQQVLDMTPTDEKPLEDIIGKDAAEKLTAQEWGPSRSGNGWQEKRLAGLDLKVGGSGMIGFYDRILPAYLNKFGKPFGARVSETRIKTAHDFDIQHDRATDRYRVWDTTTHRQLRRGNDETIAFDTHADAAAWLKENYGGTTVPVHALDVTEKMRQTALEGLPLFAEAVTPRGNRSADRDLLRQTYRDMRSVPMGDRSVVVFDAGSRFSPEEIAALTQNPAVQRIAEASLDVLDQVLDKVVGKDRAGVERTGLVLMQDIFGVYVPKPGAARGQQQRATILLNPFEAMIGPRQSVVAPSEAAKVAYYTAVHEALHWHVPFDGPDFDAQLHALLDTLGDEFRDTSTARIMETYADPDQPRKYRAGVLDLLQTYQGTRRRPATARDALSDARGGDARFADRGERESPAPRDLRPGRARTVTEQQLRTLAARAGTSVAHQREEAEKRGYTVYSIVLPGAEKLEPAVEKIAQALRNDTGLLLSLIGPAHVGVAPMAAGSARAYTAARDQQLLRVQKELAATKRVMDSWSKEKVKLFWRVMEGQEPAQSLPRSDRQYAQTLGAVLKRWTDLIVELGLIEDYLEHYFPHEWVKGSVEGDLLRRLFGRRPMQGSEAFRKHRSIPTMEEGLKIGLEPVSWNPADQVFRKVAEMARSVRARGFRDDMKRMGLYAYVAAGKTKPEAIRDWQRVPDEALGTVYGARVPEQAYGQVIAGHYYAPREVVRLVENMISRGLHGRSVLLDGFNQLGNASTATLLGWTARHIWLTGLEWAVSKFSLGIEEAGRGEIGEAAKSFAQVLGPQAAVFIARDIVKGYKDIKEFYSRDATANLTAGFVGQVIQGGGGFGRPLFDQTDAPRRFATNVRRLFGALRDGEVKEAAKSGTKALIFGALTAAEGPTLLAMEYWVPALKASAFHDLAEMELRRLGPDATLEDQRKVYGKAWDSIDNRFGQLRYDNLFWNNTFKQILMSMFLSVSWQVGSLREGVGALGQIPLTARKLKAAIEGGGGEPPRIGEEPPRQVGKGKTQAAAQGYVEPWLNRKFAWMIALMTLVITGDAIMQYLTIGKRLGEDKDGTTDWKLALRDAFAPRNGRIGPSGREERDTPISYAKDFYGWLHHPVTTTEHKLKSIWHLLADLVENEDFYGDAIYDGDDPLGTIAKDAILYTLKGSLPISYQHAKQRLAEGATLKQVLIEMGKEGASPFEPASAELERSDLEQYLHDLIPPSHRTKADAAKAAARRSMREEIRQGDPAAAHETAQTAGLSKRSEQAVRRSERIGALRSAFDHATWPQAVKAMDVATDTERATLRGAFLGKALRALQASRSSEERAHIQQQRNTALRQPQPTS